MVPRRQPLASEIGVQVAGPPGDTFQMDVCVYRAADAAAGGTFPCCKASFVDVYPLELCIAPDGHIMTDEEMEAMWLGGAP